MQDELCVAQLLQALILPLVCELSGQRCYHCRLNHNLPSPASVYGKRRRQQELCLRTHGKIMRESAVRRVSVSFCAVSRRSNRTLPDPGRRRKPFAWAKRVLHSQSTSGSQEYFAAAPKNRRCTSCSLCKTGRRRESYQVVCSSCCYSLQAGMPSRVLHKAAYLVQDFVWYSLVGIVMVAGQSKSAYRRCTVLAKCLLCV